MIMLASRPSRADPLLRPSISGLDTPGRATPSRKTEQAMVAARSGPVRPRARTQPSIDRQSVKVFFGVSSVKGAIWFWMMEVAKIALNQRIALIHRSSEFWG
jgi:hypothetical protein